LTFECIKQETSWTLRQSLLETLLESVKNIDSIRKPLRDLLQDRFDRIRFLAARALGPEGTSTLEKLLEESPGMAREILTSLWRNDDLESKRILFSSLEHPTHAVYAIPLVVRKGRTDHIEALVKILNSTENQDVARAAIQGLATIGSTEAGPHLTAFLAQAQDELLEALVAALSKCGQSDAVEPLTALIVTDKRRWEDRCQRAIEEIQSRLGDVEQGWLSMEATAELEGAVSEPENDGGQLSVLPQEHEKQVPED